MLPAALATTSRRQSRALRHRRRAAAHRAPGQPGLIATPSICRCSANASMRRRFSRQINQLSIGTVEDEQIVGHSIRRFEDINLLKGTGRFVDDIQLPGMLHATFARSPHPHAAIRSINKTAALAQKGVHAIYAFEDLRRFLSGDRLVVALPSATFKQHVIDRC